MKVFKKLVNSKATGIFDIPNRALKDYAEHIAPSLRKWVKLLQYINLGIKMI